MTRTARNGWFNATYVFAGGMVVWVGVVASLTVV